MGTKMKKSLPLPLAVLGPPAPAPATPLKEARNDVINQDVAIAHQRAATRPVPAQLELKTHGNSPAPRKRAAAPDARPWRNNHAERPYVRITLNPKYGSSHPGPQIEFEEIESSFPANIARSSRPCETLNSTERRGVLATVTPTFAGNRAPPRGDIVQPGVRTPGDATRRPDATHRIGAPPRGDIVQPGVSTPGNADERPDNAPYSSPAKGRHRTARRVNAG